MRDVAPAMQREAFARRFERLHAKRNDTISGSGFPSMLREPLIAEEPEIVVRALREHRQHRDEAGEHRNSSFHPEHRRVLLRRGHLVLKNAELSCNAGATEEET